MHTYFECNRPVSFIVCLVLAFGVGACGDVGDGDNQAQAVSKEEMPERIAELKCEKEFSCCSASEREALMVGFSDDYSTEQDCKDAIEARALEDLPARRDAVEAGRASYNAEKVGECLAYVESKSCSDFDSGNFVEECFPLFAPKVEPGGSCEEGFECKSGFCVGSMCVSYAAGGEDCSESICQDGFYCNSSDVCSATKTKSNGESCSDYAACESAICENSVCRPKRTGGESCDDNSECVSGVCDMSGLGDTTCLADPVCDGN
jgi:hypothetical protein